uniref:R13L1/DRL21-like LRR repeat region domain-containing protein n=1 Tax=Chenopodium quinoa TaxID=63459 RepID=A0A803LB13_CHEQI
MSSSKNSLLEGLEDLKALSNLKGILVIMVRYMKTGYKINGGKEDGCLVNKEHLKEVFFNFTKNGRKEYEESVMEKLQPHSNLKTFSMEGYQCQVGQGTIITWLILDNYLVLRKSGINAELDVQTHLS